MADAFVFSFWAGTQRRLRFLLFLLMASACFSGCDFFFGNASGFGVGGFGRLGRASCVFKIFPDETCA